MWGTAGHSNIDDFSVRWKYLPEEPIKNIENLIRIDVVDFKINRFMQLIYEIETCTEIENLILNSFNGNKNVD